MKRLQLEYRIEKAIAFELEVEDEIYEQFKQTEDMDLLDINWVGVHEECENSEADSDYAVNDVENGYENIIPFL